MGSENEQSDSVFGKSAAAEKPSRRWCSSQSPKVATPKLPSQESRLVSWPNREMPSSKPGNTYPD